MHVSSMSLDLLPHMQEDHVVAAPGRISQSFPIDQSTSKRDRKLHGAFQARDILSSPPPASQDSIESTASKQTSSTSSEPADERQITPTSSNSRQRSSSPLFGAGANEPSRALSSYTLLPTHNTTTAVPPEASQPCKSAGTYIVDSTAGQKRTADGIIKASRSNSNEGPAEVSTRHGRTTSTASKSSQLGGLSAQLKARLTYAKVKVEHGWETRTFKEIETLTSQPASPASGPLDHSRAFLSPRSRGLRSERACIPHSAQHLLPSDRPVTAPSRQLNYDHPSGVSALPQQTFTAASAQVAAPRASLAPPVDFQNPRRSPHVTQHIPSLAAMGSRSTLSTSSHSSNVSPYQGTLPITADQSNLLGTPSQSTMEQDAIETLLFMRSPGNSATFSQSNKNQPHQAYVESLPTQTGYSTALGQKHPIQESRMDVDAFPASPRKRRVEECVLTRANLHSSHGIDNALDEIRRRAAAEGLSPDSSDEETDYRVAY